MLRAVEGRSACLDLDSEISSAAITGVGKVEVEQSLMIGSKLPIGCCHYRGGEGSEPFR